ncbi:MAG: DUF2306 domain-containing protein [Chloroflexota bacterium]|nr:DUF2306 domain-containing protein [Chloroflexota bacterium]
MAALSALWMTHFYALPASDGALLHAFRPVFWFVMVGSIVLGFRVIRRREIARCLDAARLCHRPRGRHPGDAVPVRRADLCKPDVLARALLMGAAWTLNLAVAEWLIRGRPLWPIRLNRATARPAERLAATQSGGIGRSKREWNRGTCSISRDICHRTRMTAVR